MNVSVVSKFANSVSGAFKAGAEDFVKFAENGLKNGDIADMKAAGKVLKEKTSLAKDQVDLKNIKDVSAKWVPDESGKTAIKELLGDIKKADAGAKKIKNIATKVIDTEHLSKVEAKGLKYAKSKEALLSHFSADEQKMIEALFKAGKQRDAIELAKNIPSKVMTKLFVLDAKEFGKKLVAENGVALKSWGGKLLKEATGELFTGKISVGTEKVVVKNGLIKAIETEIDVIKFKA